MPKLHPATIKYWLVFSFVVGHDIAFTYGVHILSIEDPEYKVLGALLTGAVLIGSAVFLTWLWKVRKVHPHLL